MDTLEGNKLIAEFMEFNPNHESFSVLDYDNEFLGMRQGTWDDVEYHSSLDWQNPVWVKVCSESLKRAVTETEATRHNTLYDNYSQCVAAGNVMQGFKYLVEAIQYLNSQTPNKND